jgi:NADPH2:quinone reductase
MKAAVLWELGKGPVWQEFEEPEAGEGEAVVRVKAASLKPVDKQLASGEHYASPRETDLPMICGTDGVGTLEDGTRVFFGGCRRPFGAMAELAVVTRALVLRRRRGLRMRRRRRWRT